MPGNEVGDRVHNFFDQGGLSQDQHHTQLVEGSWPVFNNKLWSGSEKQIDGPLNSSSKNYSAQQSDIERGQSSQFSLGSHGLNFMQSNLRPPEFVKNPSQVQQWNLNGYMHSSQVIPTRPNEANFLGVDTEADRHNLTSRGPSNLESQQRQSGSQHTNSTSFRGLEPPMNFNFLGSQQQMSGQHPGMLHSLPWQQSAMIDSQLLQQQIALKQMQAIQRQQHLQQLEAMQRNAVSQMSTFPSQMSGQHSPAINGNSGNPLHDASNNPWPSQVMAGNTNWQPRGPSLAMPGYSNGPMIASEHGQPMRFMGLIPQQASQSLYGVPVSNSHNTNSYSRSSIDKPGVLQVPAQDGSFPGNQYTPFVEAASMQDEITISSGGSEGKSSFDLASSQGLGNVVNMRSFNHVQQRNVPISEGGKQESRGGSELVPEKSVSQPASSQAAVSLDPTEEKILFGNDESIWEAFGGPSLTGSGSTSRLDTADLNGFSSVQSGTWSALMQSAVAEISNSDTGMQVECSGVSSQSSQMQSGYQMPPVLDNGKQQPVWVDSSQRASLGSQSATNNVRTTDYGNASRLPQPFLNQTESQILHEGRKLLDHNQLKPYFEQNQVIGVANSSRDGSKTDIGFRSHQQSTFLPQNSGQASGRSNALNFIESVPKNGGVASNNQDKFASNVRYRDMSMEGGHDAAMRFESVSNSNFKIGSLQVNSLNDTSTSSLRNMKVHRESGQNFLDNNHFDLWKPVNSSVNCGTDSSEKDQPNLNDGPPILESSATISDGGAAGLHETENVDRRENLNDSHVSSNPGQAPPGGLRDNVCLDAVDQLSLPGGNEKVSGQSFKNMPVSGKFQYHPMGDVGMDVESSYVAKHVFHSQPMSHHLSSVIKGHETQPRFIGSSTKSIDMEKGCASSSQGAAKMSHGVASSGPDYFPNSSGTFVGSGEISTSNQHTSPSQKMLELLHKVDQSKEQNIASHLSSSDCNRMSDVAFLGAVGLNQSQSSTAHGFNLQLAPPSQGVGPSNLHVASQSSSRRVVSPSSDDVASDKGDKAHAWLGPVSSAQCLPPSHPAIQMQTANNTPGTLGNMDADGSLQNLNGKLRLVSGSADLNNLLQNQQSPAAGGRMITDNSVALSLNRHALHDHQNSDSQDHAAAIPSVNNLHHNLSSGKNMNHSGMGTLMHQMPATANMSGMFRKDNLPPPGANLWTSQHHLLGARGHNSHLLKSQFPLNDSSENSFLPQLKKDEQDGPRKSDSLSSQGTIDRGPSVVEAQSAEQTTGASEEKELIMRRPSDASSPSNSFVSQKDGEGFHDTVKLNNVAKSSYSLLHHMQAMKSTVMIDPSNRESKRLKGLDNGTDSQQIATKAAQPFTSGVNNDGVRDPSVSHTSVSAVDANVLSFSSQPGNRIASFQMPHGSVASQDVLSFGCPQNFTPGNLDSRIGSTSINCQMTPSWFEQYGTLKNGQMLPVQNVSRIPVNKNMEQQFISGTSLNNLVAQDSVQVPNPAADTGQISNTCQTTSLYTPREHISSKDALVPHVSTSLSSMRPKKRKIVTSDLLPWHQEIGQGIKRLQNMSSAEIDWAQSSNRLVEKIEDENDTNEELLPMIRPKRRLILTAQLMQQVFQPPSAAVLSLDAAPNCEVVVYSLARLAFGDACSVICCMGSDPSGLPECGNLLSKVKTSEKIRDQYFSKVVENFSNRAKQLENDLLRLDKYASILDIRLDCQDLERFSVINHFAKFRGRGQVDGSETSSSSDVTVMAQKPCPQRYVSAHPMPRIVPDRVQCLSL